MAALLIGVLLILFLRQVLTVVMIFYFSVVLSHAVEPAIGFGERHRVPRVATVVAVYLAMLLALVLLLLLVVPPLIVQITALVGTVPSALRNIESFLETYRGLAAESETAAILGQLAGRLGQELIGLTNTLLLVPLQLTQIIVVAVSVPIISFYWLIDSVRIEKKFLSLLPEVRREEAQGITSAIARQTGAFIRGQIIAMVTVGLLSYVGLMVLGVDFALMLGVTAGLLEVVPFIGPPVSAIPAFIIAFLVSPVLALEVVVLYIAIQQLESNVIVPKVMQREVGLHPLVVIAALWMGGSLLGLPGAFLAIPASASFEVLFDRVVFPWIRSWRW